ncbi:hypothetical protein [Taklimakanibacter deserti]|uniref:hypothetical protein n=1 Tax=Taklimakanibacter deserti TaxID=2267839 RepID=UPI000E645FB9
MSYSSFTLIEEAYRQRHAAEVFLARRLAGMQRCIETSRKLEQESRELIARSRRLLAETSTMVNGHGPMRDSGAVSPDARKAPAVPAKKVAPAL